MRRYLCIGCDRHRHSGRGNTQLFILGLKFKSSRDCPLFWNDSQGDETALQSDDDMRTFNSLG